MTEIDGTYRYLLDEVRTHDRERYLTTLFARASARPHLIALLAFDLELARVPGLVSEPLLGEIRYQWWRDQLAGAAGDGTGTPPDSPVVEGLLAAVEAAALPMDEILAVIDGYQTARADDVGDSAGLAERHAKATTGAVHRLMARVLGEDGHWALDAAQEAGTALGIARLICSRATTLDQRQLNGMKARARLCLREVSEYGPPGRHVLPAFMAGTLARELLRAHRRARKAGKLTQGPPQIGHVKCLRKLVWTRFSGKPW